MKDGKVTTWITFWVIAIQVVFSEALQAALMVTKSVSAVPACRYDPVWSTTKREKHSDSYVSTDTIAKCLHEALTTVKVKCVRFYLTSQHQHRCPLPLWGKSAQNNQTSYIHILAWHELIEIKRFDMFSDPLPPPGLCQRCRNWKCRGQRAGRRSRGRAPQTLRLWPTCKAERKRSRDRDLQPVWLWERAWKSHWRSRRCLEYRKSGENIQNVCMTGALLQNKCVLNNK